jgi:hypothetical protein
VLNIYCFMLIALFINKSFTIYLICYTKTYHVSHKRLISLRRFYYDRPYINSSSSTWKTINIINVWTSRNIMENDSTIIIIRKRKDVRQIRYSIKKWIVKIYIFRHYNSICRTFKYVQMIYLFDYLSYITNKQINVKI